jgi:peptidoglycan biosynthesis protein MviN/MurJ (putative lipid II flippase)
MGGGGAPRKSRAPEKGNPLAGWGLVKKKPDARGRAEKGTMSVDSRLALVLAGSGGLLVGLVRKGSYRPEAGWGRFLLQVFAGSALLVIYLLWVTQAFDWIELRANSFKRIGLMLGLLCGALVVYLGAVWAAGLNPRQFLRR